MELRPGYKRTEVGVIPEEWEVKPLELILRAGRLGGNYPNQVQETESPLIKMGNLARGRMDMSKMEYIPPGVAINPIHRLSEGDVLFNTRNTLELVGKVAIWRDELPVAFYNSNLMRLEFNPLQVVSNEYACATLNTSVSVANLRALATGTTSVAAIYTRDLMRMPIVVPPPREQHEIAMALSNMDALLEGLERLIAKKRDLKQAVMQQLLTGQTRLPGFTQQWKVKRLGKIATCYSGGTPPTAIAAYYDGDIPWITSSDLNKECINAVEGRISYAGLQNSAAKIVEPGTLLIALYGATSGIAAISTIKAAINQAVLAIIPQNENSEFLYFKLRLLRNWLISTYTQGGQPNLSGEIVKSLELPMPPVLEQIAIATVLKDMDTELIALEQRLAKTCDLKQAMMQELLTGRTRLVAPEIAHA